MRNLDNGPQDGQPGQYWGMALVAVTARIDSTVADIITVGLIAYMMWLDHRSRR